MWAPAQGPPQSRVGSFKVIKVIFFSVLQEAMKRMLKQQFHPCESGHLANVSKDVVEPSHLDEM